MLVRTKINMPLVNSAIPSKDDMMGVFTFFLTLNYLFHDQFPQLINKKDCHTRSGWKEAYNSYEHKYIDTLVPQKHTGCFMTNK